MKKLKFLGLGLLAIIGFFGFSNAVEYYVVTTQPNSVINIGGNSTGLLSSGCYNYANIKSNFDFYNLSGDLLDSPTGNNSLYCFKNDFYAYNKSSNNKMIYKAVGIYYDEFVAIQECQECETCPSTGDILSGYIAISDITTNYCTSNDLCPEMSGGNSAIFINDIWHESMPFINVYIPEEFEWNYNYTGNGTQLDIEIEGYGYDQEKMQNMVNTQFYKPTDEEMSGLIGKIADFLPLIAVALLIIRVRRVIKKVFRF